MDDATGRLRAATDAVVACLTVVHANAAPTAQASLAVSRLVVAVADLVHVQESVNAAVRDALRADARRYSRMEARLDTLEVALCASPRAPLADSQHAITPLMRPRMVADASVDSDADPSADDDACAVAISVASAVPRSPLALCPPVGAVLDEKAASYASDAVPLEPDAAPHEPNPVPFKPKGAPLEGEVTTSEQKPARKRQMTSPGEDDRGAKRTRRLPALPSARDVEVELQHTMRARRVAKQQLPLPCGKCRVRKRADMMRRFGRVKEDVYDRWINKPGACFPFMHMDEPGAPRSPLTFEETPTESPRPILPPPMPH